MCRHGCWVHHFRMVIRMVIGDIPGEAALAIQRNPWDKVLTDGHGSLVRAL